MITRSKKQKKPEKTIDKPKIMKVRGVLTRSQAKQLFQFSLPIQGISDSGYYCSQQSSEKIFDNLQVQILPDINYQIKTRSRSKNVEIRQTNRILKQKPVTINKKRTFNLRQRTNRVKLVLFKEHVNLSNLKLQMANLPSSIYQPWCLDSISENGQYFQMFKFVEQVSVEIIRFRKSMVKNVLYQLIHIKFPNLFQLDLKNNNQTSVEILQLLDLPSLTQLYLNFNPLINVRTVRKMSSQNCQLIHDAQTMGQLWAPKLNKLIYKPRVYRMRAPAPFETKFADFYRQFFKLEASIAYYLRDLNGTYSYFVKYLNNSRTD